MRGGVGVCLNGLSTRPPADPKKNRAERRAADSNRKHSKGGKVNFNRWTTKHGRKAGKLIL
tara:strand:+ start:725 stop:907 length:183 start_codon:yes stop_codon:yes gene_type:complete